jgi:hypothetical protein
VYIELTPELEKAVLAESESTGLSPAEIAHRALAAHTAGAKLSPPEVPAASIEFEGASECEMTARRQAAVERIRQRSMEPDGPKLGLPPNVRFRDWIHEGHRY